MNRVFTRVEYPQFRQFLDGLVTGRIRHKGYETVICDRDGDLQALVHAPSIDEKGRLYPAAYYIRTSALTVGIPAAA